MSEAGFSKDFCRLTASLDPVRVENLLTGKKHTGIPDINIIPGWVELKWLKSYPVREDTPVRMHRYTDEQRQWLLRRAKAGGKTWLALRVRSHIYIFDSQGAQEVGLVPRKRLREICIAFWDKPPSPEEFCKVFTS